MNRYNTPAERIFDGFRDTTHPMNGLPFGKNESGGQDESTNGMPLAMIYAPESTFSNIYDDREALGRGTLFSDLYFPFEAPCFSSNANGGGMR